MFRMILLFGYIRPQKSELLVREYEEYSGIYCTLCRRLGKDYGPAARLALNFDCTFFALMLLAAKERDCPHFFRKHCVVNPLKKCVYCHDSGDFQAAAGLTVLLTYYKLSDDVEDSRFFKSFFSRILRLLAAGAKKKAAKSFPRFDAIIADSMKTQGKIECLEHPGIDRCAEPTAKMISQVFETIAESSGGRSSDQKRILHEFGYFLGRWIYLIDAADDLRKDIEQNTFNPFARYFCLDSSSTREKIDSVVEYANQVLNGTLSRLNATVNLLSFNSFGPIVRNVIFNGLPQMQKERLFTKESRNVRPL